MNETEKQQVRFIITIPAKHRLKGQEKQLAKYANEHVVRLTVAVADLHYFVGDKAAAEFIAKVQPIFDDPRRLPVLLTVDEATNILRLHDTRALYARVARGQVAGVCRHRRRLLFRRDEFLAAALEGDR